MKIGSRPVSKPLRAPFRDDLAVQVKQVIIRKVRPEEVTPWIHGLVVVPKKQGCIRFCRTCGSADTGSPVYCNNKAEYKTSIKQTEREGRVEANRRAELTLLFSAESARIYTERE